MIVQRETTQINITQDTERNIVNLITSCSVTRMAVSVSVVFGISVMEISENNKNSETRRKKT